MEPELDTSKFCIVLENEINPFTIPDVGNHNGEFKLKESNVPYYILNGEAHNTYCYQNM